jgi:hypothetical protein
MQREELLYVSCIHEGTGVAEPDHPAVVEVHPDSDTCRSLGRCQSLSSMCASRYRAFNHRIFQWNNPDVRAS